jgi:hypothetical protein
MSASKALETLLVCTCLAQSALSSGINDDFICNKVVRKFFSREHFLFVGQRLNEHRRTAGATERAFTYACSLVHGEQFSLD